MSLTATDLGNIRTIVKEEVREVTQKEVKAIVQTEVRAIFQVEARTTMREVVRDELSTLEGKVEALENDVKAIYFMLAKLEKSSIFVSKEFQKLSLEAKLLRINTDLLAAAKQAGITLPR